MIFFPLGRNMSQFTRPVIFLGLVVLCTPASVLGGGLPKPKYCGNIVASRITGGDKAGLDEFPWTALIWNRNGFACGGTLINERYVLTAAHCVVGKNVTSVRLGEYDLDHPGEDCDGEECADPPVDVDAEINIVHETYNKRWKLSDDIALIRLSRDVTFTKYIQPICLPVDSAQRTLQLGGMKATATGWGYTETRKYLGSVKLKVDLDIIDQDYCHSFWKPRGYTTNDHHICAGVIDMGKGTCSGDSGGPLMLRIGLEYFQYGVTSYNFDPCGEIGLPTGFTNVVKYMDWIESHIK